MKVLKCKVENQSEPSGTRYHAHRFCKFHKSSWNHVESTSGAVRSCDLGLPLAELALVSIHVINHLPVRQEEISNSLSIFCSIPSHCCHRRRRGTRIWERSCGVARVARDIDRAKWSGFKPTTCFWRNSNLKVVLSGTSGTWRVFCSSFTCSSFSLFWLSGAMCVKNTVGASHFKLSCKAAASVAKRNGRSAEGDGAGATKEERRSAAKASLFAAPLPSTRTSFPPRTSQAAADRRSSVR